MNALSLRWRLPFWLARPLVAFCGLYMASSSAQAPLDVRVALVVGNAAYAGALALKNPTNDATAMAAALKDLGFTVIEARDASRAQMEDGVKQLFSALKGKQGVGLLYYAGHGLQVDMRNYMVPVDARLQSAKDVPGQTLDVADVLDAMKAAGSRMNIVVLDACRNNPFKDKSGNGLAPVDAPAGTLLAYATAPGNVAEDGTGSNGLYTKHLLAELQKPVGIENVFKRVRLNVRQESRGRQIPWESTSLEDDFYFKRDAVAVKPSPAQRNNEYVDQKAAWDKIKDSKNADDFYSFLAAFPSGMLSEIALFKLERLAATPLTMQPPAGEKPQTQMADRLKVGDEWTTEETDSMSMFGGKDTHVYKVVSQEGDLLAVKRGAMATFYYTPSGAYAGLDQPLVPKVMYDPPIPLLPSGPFQVGYKASSRSSNVRGGGAFGDFEATIHVLAREKITTKLGTFDAYKIEVRANAAGAMGGPTESVFTKWYEAGSAIPLREVLEIRSFGRRIVKDTVAIKRAG